MIKKKKNGYSWKRSIYNFYAQQKTSRLSADCSAIVSVDDHTLQSQKPNSGEFKNTMNTLLKDTQEILSLEMVTTNLRCVCVRARKNTGWCDIWSYHLSTSKVNTLIFSSRIYLWQTLKILSSLSLHHCSSSTLVFLHRPLWGVRQAPLGKYAAAHQRQKRMPTKPLKFLARRGLERSSDRNRGVNLIYIWVFQRVSEDWLTCSIA